MLTYSIVSHYQIVSDLARSMRTTRWTLAVPPRSRLPPGAFMSMLGVLRGPRQVLFGAGQRHALGTLTAALGTRALVCTDARFASTREYADLVQLLEGAGV